MQMQLSGRLRMELSWIQLNKADEQLLLVTKFSCEKVRMALGKISYPYWFAKEENLPVMFFKSVL